MFRALPLSPSSETPKLQGDLFAEDIMQRGLSEDSLRFLVRLAANQQDMEFIRGDGWGVSPSAAACKVIEEYLTGVIPSLDSYPDELFRFRRFLYTDTDLTTRPVEETLGVMEHELGHCLHTSMRLTVEGQKLALEQGYLATTFLEFLNACEDPRVNILRGRASESARRNIDCLYDSCEEPIELTINRQSITRQLGLAIISYWYNGSDIATLADERVSVTMMELQPHLERFFNEPSPTVSHRRFVEKIWPICRQYEALAFREEELREIARFIARSEFGRLDSSESQGALEKLWKAAISRLWRPAAKGAKELGEQITASLASVIPPGFREDLSNELSKQATRQTAENEHLASKGKAGGRLEIELSTMPAGMREELARLFDHLPPDLRKAVVERAYEAQQTKSERNARDSSSGGQRVGRRPDGKRVVTPDSTPPRRSQRKEERSGKPGGNKNQASDSLNAQRGPSSAEIMQAQGFDRTEKELFDQFVEVEARAQETIGGMLDVFNSLTSYAVRQGDPEGGFYRGTGIAAKELGRRLPVGDLRIATRISDETVALRRPFNVTLALDNSISMEGEKSNACRELAIIMGRVATIRRDPLSILSFSGMVSDIMAKGDDYDDPAARVKPRLVAFTNGDGAGTNIGAAVERASEMIDEASAASNALPIVFFVSDGQPTEGVDGEELRQHIDALRGKAVVIQLYLGGKESELTASRDIFGEEWVLPIHNPRELPLVAASALVGLLTRN